MMSNPIKLSNGATLAITPSYPLLDLKFLCSVVVQSLIC